MSDTPENQEDLSAGRRTHHQQILDSEGYPTRFDRTDWAADLHQRFTGLEPGTHTDETTSVAGRLMLSRSFGKLQFATIADMSGTIQLFVDKGHIGEEKAEGFEDLDLGDWVGAHGTIMTTRKGELSVLVNDFVVLQKSLHPLPDKFHGLQDIEQRSRRRYLDLMVNEDSRQVALTRAKVVSALRREFENRGFIEVETPVLLAQATGATARPFHTTHNALDMDMYLRIATELYLKRLVVGGLERVFEIGRIFRNEGIDSTHNPEFTMLEAYQALADYEDVMELVEEVIGAVAVEAVGSTEVTFDDKPVSLQAPFRRVSMLDLVSEALGEEVNLDIGMDRLLELAAERSVDVEDGWTAGRIIAEFYEQLVESSIWDPTFVTHPPVEVSPLSRRNQEDPRLADRFELIIAGSEYANAFSELTDAADQLARFEEQAAAREAGDDEAHPVDLDYIEALEYGLPPTGGLGIGVDRLVMLLTGQTHIRDVILFPTMRPL